jgi:hypothetical protein
MQTGDGDRPAYGFKRARFVGPLKVAAAFAAALFGALRQVVQNMLNRAGHDRASDLVPGANRGGFDVVKRTRRLSGVIRYDLLEPLGKLAKQGLTKLRGGARGSRHLGHLQDV